MRFVDAFRAYISSVPEQATRREIYRCTIPEFIAVRRENAGIRPSFVLIEACMKLDSIPQEVMDHEALKSLTNDACDLISIDNVSAAP